MTTRPLERERLAAINATLRMAISRVAALALFAAGLLYWSRLIGATGIPEWRFDMMPVWWRMAAPVLAVLYPVAGTGVWMLTSWGTVIWVLVFMIETVMHLGFPELFGTDAVTLGLHAAGLALLLALRIVVFFEQRRL